MESGSHQNARAIAAWAAPMPTPHPIARLVVDGSVVVDGCGDGGVHDAPTGGEDGLEVGGDVHRLDGADVGAAGVAERVAPHRGAGTGDEEPEELPGDLAAVAVADPEAEHRHMGADVGDGEGLAEDVGPLEVVALTERVTGGAGLAGGGVLVGPGLADGGGVLGLGLLGEVRHRRFLSMVLTGVSRWWWR